MAEITADATYTTTTGIQRTVTVNREFPDDGDAADLAGGTADMAASLLPDGATLHSVSITIDRS
jgi:hypothetical protein